MRLPRARPGGELIAAGTLLALGVLYGVLALNEGLGTMAETDAGFFPFVVALVLVAASGVVLVRDRPRRVPEPASPAGETENETEHDAEDVDGTVHWWRVVGVVLAALLVPLLGTTVGMIVTLSVSLVLIAKIMGLSRWTSAVILGIAFGAATWLIFVRWLYVPLPTGTLGLI